MSKILLHTLDRYEIRDKVGWFTADNATNNDTTLVSLAESLNTDDKIPCWDTVEHRVRCMEHAVHLVAGHFISDVSPMSAKAVLAKAVNQFALTADESDEVPDLQGKNYIDFKLTKRLAEDTEDARSSPAKIQESFSSAKFPTPQKFADMKDSINAGLENLAKWYQKADDTDVYSTCPVLGLNYKTAYAENNWAPESFDEGMDKLKAKVPEEFFV
ncbi:hypothetical protein B0H10DRAFT_2446187 [Mycena sp. CBHHK59/15]|nr:hypothetical protein B0H10DRAFT_2446187 [Mycena sp. CBHHK59/15]